MREFGSVMQTCHKYGVKVVVHEQNATGKESERGTLRFGEASLTWQCGSGYSKMGSYILGGVGFQCLGSASKHEACAV